MEKKRFRLLDDPRVEKIDGRDCRENDFDDDCDVNKQM